MRWDETRRDETTWRWDEMRWAFFCASNFSWVKHRLLADYKTNGSIWVLFPESFQEYRNQSCSQTSTPTIAEIGKYERFLYRHTTFKYRYLWSRWIALICHPAFKAIEVTCSLNFIWGSSIFTSKTFMSGTEAYIGVIYGWFYIVVAAFLISNEHKLEFLWISLKVVFKPFYE